jgi:hypothetical protein
LNTNFAYPAGAGCRLASAGIFLSGAFRTIAPDRHCRPFEMERPMRKPSLIGALAVALLAGGIGLAKEKPAEGRKEKKICKADRESKSRIPKKTCLTEAEWAAKSAQDDLDDSVARLRAQGRIE